MVPVQTLARDRVAAETTHGANIATLLNITSVERGMVCQKGTFELCDVHVSNGNFYLKVQWCNVSLSLRGPEGQQSLSLV